MKPTYDEIQMAATLTFCLACCRWFYMTKPQPLCVRCRQQGKALCSAISAKE